MTAVRYTGDGVAQAWLIPFPYGGPGDLRVEITENGETSTLSHAAGDFRIIDRCVVCPVQSGAILAITLITPLYQVAALNERRVKAASLAMQNEERAAFHAQAAAQIAEDAAAIAHAACEKLEENVADIVTPAEERIDALASSLLADSASLREAAITMIMQAAREAIERTHNPGLSAVPALSLLDTATQGFYVVNPYLSGQVGAQGIWGTRSINDIAWDGYFVILPDCPGHAGACAWTPSGFAPGNASPESGDGSDDAPRFLEGKWWLPCDHVHQ